MQRSSSEPQYAKRRTLQVYPSRARTLPPYPTYCDSYSNESPRVRTAWRYSMANGCFPQRVAKRTRSGKYLVHPSPLIKSAHVNRWTIDAAKSSPLTDPALRLSALEYSGKQQLIWKELKAEEAAAEQAKAFAELQENAVLLAALRKGMDFTCLDLDAGVDVAVAARQTLEAEEQYVLRKLDLCQQELRIIQDELEEIRARVSDAKAQETSLKSLRSHPAPAPPDPPQLRRSPW